MSSKNNVEHYVNMPIFLDSFDNFMTSLLMECEFS